MSFEVDCIFFVSSIGTLVLSDFMTIKYQLVKPMMHIIARMIVMALLLYGSFISLLSYYLVKSVNNVGGIVSREFPIINAISAFLTRYASEHGKSQ
jgi:hypothetical protein